jgi:hypothetical protein
LRGIRVDGKARKGRKLGAEGVFCGSNAVDPCAWFRGWWCVRRGGEGETEELGFGEGAGEGGEWREWQSYHPLGEARKEEVKSCAPCEQVRV